MIHRLAVGHFDSEKVASSGQLVIIRSLDMSVVHDLLQKSGYQDEALGFAIGGDQVQIEHGYIICPYLIATANVESVKFMLRIHDATNCMFLDMTSGQTVSVDELRESIAT